MVKSKTFRKDLFYRLNVLPIVIPPLRNRKEDIIPLLKHFEELYSKKYNIKKQISPTTCRDLINYEWPGNIRELMHVVERLLLTDEAMVLNEIMPEKQENYGAISGESNLSYCDNVTLKSFMNNVEKQYILKVLESSKTLKEAAKKMDIEISTLVRKNQKYNISRSYQ